MSRQTIRERLMRNVTPELQRRIRRLWIHHSMAEDDRDIDGPPWRSILPTGHPGDAMTASGSGSGARTYQGVRATHERDRPFHLATASGPANRALRPPGGRWA